MQYHIAICDDLEYFIADLKHDILTYTELNHYSVMIDCFQSGKELLADFHANKYDIIFLDVEMPVLNGIDTARVIREKDKDVTIIFITSHESFSLQAAQIDSFGYLVKPVNKERLFRIIRNSFFLMKEIETQKEKENEIFEFIENYEKTFVTFSSIIYIEKYRNQIIIHLNDRTSKTCYDTIKNIKKKLPKSYFFQISSGVIINVNYIQQVKAYETILSYNNTSVILGIGRKFYKQVNEAYLNHLAK